MKKHISLILATLILATFLAGCNSNNKNSGNNSSTEQVSSEVDDEFARTFYYESYIDELDSYMKQYTNNADEMDYNFTFLENDEANTCIGEMSKALNNLEGITCPEAIKDEHDKLLSAVELEKQLVQCRAEYYDLFARTGSIVPPESFPEEQDAFNMLFQKRDEILTEIEKNGSIREHWSNVRAAACSYMLKGEYNTYAFEVKKTSDLYYFLLSDTYSYYDILMDCLAKLENMEVPELAKPYHDDILSAIQDQREFCEAKKTISDIFTLEDLSDDEKKKYIECNNIVDEFMVDEDKFYALHNAVVAAQQFALKQIN